MSQHTQPIQEKIASEQVVQQANNTEDVIQQVHKSLENANQFKQQGNEIFKNNQFNEAIELYQKGINVCPEQQKQLLCVLNSNVSICYMKLNDVANTIEFAKKAVDYNPKYRKAWLNLANAYNNDEKPQQALEAYKKANQLQNDPSLTPIITKLSKKVDQINQKRKTEVIDGLKGIGNSILGYFNLSLDNFKMNQNPDGTYGMSFQQ